MLKIIGFIFIVITLNSYAKESVSRVVYFNETFGHIHKNASRYSQSLTTIECNHPVKVLKNTKGEIKKHSFYKVKVGPYVGHIDESYLSSKKVNCFASRYPKFYDGLDLEIVDTFYWGKLKDQYVKGKSKIK